MSLTFDGMCITLGITRQLSYSQCFFKYQSCVPPRNKTPLFGDIGMFLCKLAQEWQYTELYCLEELMEILEGACQHCSTLGQREVNNS